MSRLEDLYHYSYTEEDESQAMYCQQLAEEEAMYCQQLSQNGKVTV